MRTLFAAGHIEPIARAEHADLVSRLVQARRVADEFPGDGAYVSVLMAERALTAFERAHPVGGRASLDAGGPPTSRHLPPEPVRP